MGIVIHRCFKRNVSFGKIHRPYQTTEALRRTNSADITYFLTVLDWKLQFYFYQINLYRKNKLWSVNCFVNIVRRKLRPYQTTEVFWQSYWPEMPLLSVYDTSEKSFHFCWINMQKTCQLWSTKCFVDTINKKLLKYCMYISTGCILSYVWKQFSNMRLSWKCINDRENWSLFQFLDNKTGYKNIITQPIKVTPNGRHGVTNRKQLHGLFNNMFKLTTKKH